MDRKRKLGSSEVDRIECPGLTKDTCEQFMCVYEEVIDGPFCYMEKDSFGYSVQSVTEKENETSILLEPLEVDSPYGPSLKNVSFKIMYITENIVRFQFKDEDNERYEVPVQDTFPLLNNLTEVDVDNLNYSFTHTNESEVFHFQVTRNDGTTLWDTTIGGLLLSDQYLQIASYLPSQNVYGIGENLHESLKHNMSFISWPLFSQDMPPNGGGKNLYGVHPFYTCLEYSGKSHGVLFLNSNAMEVTLLPAPAISFRTIGGILDFFIFVGDDPEHVIQLYTSLIGRPMMPPYWGLGFQLSRYGYGSLDKLKQVLERTRKAKIPQDVQYLDIDHMSGRKDFTYNESSFPGLPDFIESYKSKHNMKWVIILDPAMDSDENYEPYSTGLESRVFIKRPKNWPEWMFPVNLQDVNVTFGKVWNVNYSAFPDFLLPETKEWWKDLIVNYQNTLGFDGLWIDMNEPANFETNIDDPFYCKGASKCWSLKCPDNDMESPPYNPLQMKSNEQLSKKTLCMDSIQGNDSYPYRHYDVHSLYGWSQTQATYEAAQEATNTRSLVISRSTYPSSGRYAGHWLGDNESTFKDMRLSIIGMLEFNLFGIPYIGADVCGFFRDTTPELCKRWMQLGAFYPNFRNHNNKDQLAQDPGYLGPDVAEVSRKAVIRRITLNPYLYTLFYKAHVYGNTVVRPLFHEFPTDKATWNIDKQFLWGRDLLITPVLEAGRSSVPMYIPPGEWWQFQEEKSFMHADSKQYILLPNAVEYIPIHARGGSIIPLGQYDPEQYPDNSTTREISLYIFPENDYASGDLFMDDLISIDTIENEAYAVYQFTYSNCSLQIQSDERANFTGPNPVLNKVVAFKVYEIDSVSGNYTFTHSETSHLIVITVETPMKNVKEITWEDSNGNCGMKP